MIVNTQFGSGGTTEVADLTLSDANQLIHNGDQLYVIPVQTGLTVDTVYSGDTINTVRLEENDSGIYGSVSNSKYTYYGLTGIAYGGIPWVTSNLPTASIPNSYENSYKITNFNITSPLSCNTTLFSGYNLYDWLSNKYDTIPLDFIIYGGPCILNTGTTEAVQAFHSTNTNEVTSSTSCYFSGHWNGTSISSITSTLNNLMPFDTTAYDYYAAPYYKDTVGTFYYAITCKIIKVVLS